MKLQDWVVHRRLQGRRHLRRPGRRRQRRRDRADHAALNPRVCRVVALPAPTNASGPSGTFSATSPHLPAAGEIVLFDRSWYNRAGVERVMGFCTDAELRGILPERAGIRTHARPLGHRSRQYWFSITDDEQQLRFTMRIHDPLKQWKLSPMDLESRRRWEAYTKAKEDMLDRTNIPEAPWWVVGAVDKRRARLNCISHLLTQIPYQEVEHEAVTLPERVRNPDYLRSPVPPEMYVPDVY